LFGDPNQAPTHAVPRPQSGFHEAPTYHASPGSPSSPADANPTQQLPSNRQQGGHDSSQSDPYGQPPPNQYGPPPNQYDQQPTQYGPPPNQYDQQPTQYGPPNQYGQQPNQYDQQPAQYGQQPNQYDQQPTQYGQQPNQYGGQQPDEYQPWPSDGAGGEPPDGDGHGSRMWLWAIAGVAVLLVIGLVVAVLIVTSSSDETVVAPPLQPSATGATTTPRTTTSRAPAPSPSDETTTSETTTSGTPGVTEQVVYNVGGTGTALNITYVDDGDVLQTEFRVTLPWTKTVQLEQPAKDKASVSVVKLGGDVSCSISVAGAEVSNESGRGLTMCKAPR
jgi:hypothetical protein